MTDKAGFTLIEVIIVMAVLSVSALVTAEVLNKLNLSAKYPEAKVSLGALSIAVRETLKYQKTCQQAFAPTQGVTPASLASDTQEVKLNLPGILGDGNPVDDVLQATSDFQQLRVNNVRLVNTVDLGGGKFFAEIELRAQVTNTNLSLKPLSCGGFVFTLASGKISCLANNQDPTPLCEEMGCTWNPSTTPSCQCSPIDLSCPPQQFLTGVDLNGKPVCKPLGAGPCPIGTYLRGMSIGANDCAPLASTTGAVTGSCGSANNSAYKSAASVNASGLCLFGNPTPATVSGPGPWSWQCTGISGGGDANCSATVLPATAPSCLEACENQSPNSIDWYAELYDTPADCAAGILLGTSYAGGTRYCRSCPNEPTKWQRGRMPPGPAGVYKCP